MRLFLLTLGVVTFLLGCASVPQAPQMNHWAAISSLPVGSSKDAVVKILGPPSKEEIVEGTTMLTYSIPYKGLQIPKAVVWLSSENRVIEKKINLFKKSSDAMNLTDVESRMGHLNLSKVGESSLGHNIPATRTLRDEKNGVSVEARESEILSVSWFEKSRNPAQSP